MTAQLNMGKMQSLLGNLSQIKQSIDAVGALESKEKAIEYLTSRSPQMKQALEYVNANGGDAKAVCHQILKDNGLDPQMLENALTKL